MENKNEKKLLDFVVSVHEPFKETYRVEMVTATELACLIDTVFGGVFNDYYKCSLTPIRPNQFGPAMGYELSLSFRPKANATEDPDDNGKFAAFVQKSVSENKSGNEIFANIKKISTIAKSMNECIISQPAAELLRTLFIDGYINDRRFYDDPSPKKYCNQKLIGEKVVQEAVGYNRFSSVIEDVVLHLDINKVITMIKGDTDENGDKLFYSIRPVTDIRPNVANNTGMVPVKTETVLEIVCLNGAEWEKFSARTVAEQTNPSDNAPFRFINA